MDRLKAYSVLGVGQNAGEAEVKAAYKTLAQKYNVDNYEAGPLRDEAEAKMGEINDAFDTLMSFLRTGGTEATRPQTNSGSTHAHSYPNIRQLINSGRIDEALSELSQIPGGASDAEWNFLMGSAYYYKGWLDQAMRYFQQAVNLAPGNREYEAALRNLQNSAGGNMQGNPYGQQDQSAQAMNCACNTCSMMCCMDACCSMCRGC